MAPVNDAHGNAMIANDNVTAKEGMQFLTKFPLNLISVTIFDVDTDPTKCYLYNDNGSDDLGSLIATVDITSGVATFNEVLADATKYWVVVDNDGGSYRQAVTPATGLLPTVMTNVNWTKDYVTDAPSAETRDWTFTVIRTEEITAENILVSENLSMSDSFSSIKTTSKNVSDSLSLTDSFSLSKNLFISESESISLTDNLQVDRMVNRGFSDNLSLSDTFSYVADLSVSYSDNISLSDTVGISLVREISVSDSMSLTDSVSLSAKEVESMVDNLNLTDNLSIERSKAWDISKASFLQEKAFTNINPYGLFFKSDGLSLYVSGAFASEEVYQFSLSSAWDISTLNTTPVGSFDITSEADNVKGVFFKSDGTKMYIVGPDASTGNENVYQYTLSTPWLVSSASFDSVQLEVEEESSTKRGITFKPDGSIMYLAGSDNVFEYALGTDWDLSTASYTRFEELNEPSDLTGVYFKTDGSKMYVIDKGSDNIYQYTLSTPFNISTTTYDSKLKYVGDKDTNPEDLFFRVDGEKMYFVGSTNDSIYEYNFQEPNIYLSESLTLTDNFSGYNPQTYDRSYSDNLTLTDAFDLTTIPEGQVNRDTFFVLNGDDWVEFNSFEYFRVKKRQNQSSEFEIKIYDISTEQKAYFKEQAEVLFFAGEKMILKGRIQNINYGTAFEVIAKGYGMEAKLSDKQFIVGGDNRVEYSNTSAKTIATQINDSILTTASSGLWDTDFGNISMRFEYANRLNSLAKTIEAIDYYWWIDQSSSDAYSTNYLNLDSNQGETSSQQTFDNDTSTKAIQQKDIVNVVNYVYGLGYGDGINQLKTSVYAASTQSSFLNSNITATDSSITLSDASGLDNTGSARIAEEQITYLGIDSNTLTGCTRGQNSTTALEHNKNCYIEQHFDSSTPQTGSSIQVYGLLDQSMIDKSIVDLPTLEVVASGYLTDNKTPIIRIKIMPDEPISALSLDIGDNVTVVDEEADISGDYRIVGIEYSSNFGVLSAEIEVSNKSLEFIEQMGKTKQEAEISSKYMQGSTNIYAINEAENCDDSTPLNLRFYLPEDAIGINRVLLSFKMKDYRAYSSDVIADTGSTNFNFDTVGTTDSSGFVWQNGPTVTLSSDHNNGVYLYYHLAVVSWTGNPSGTYGYDVRFYDGDSTYYPGTSSSNVLRGPSGNLNDTGSFNNYANANADSSYFVSGNQSGKVFTLQARTQQSVTEPTNFNSSLRYQTITPNLTTETLTSPSVDLSVGEEGSEVPIATYTTDQVNIDITDEVRNVGAGNWINIKFDPNKRMRIETDAYVQIFIESK